MKEIACDDMEWSNLAQDRFFSASEAGDILDQVKDYQLFRKDSVKCVTLNENKP
jgi:hypothetical protein